MNLFKKNKALFFSNGDKEKKIIFKRNFKLILFISIILFVPLFAFSQVNINTLLGGFKVNKNTSGVGVKVDVHNACQVVKNSSTVKDYFIPTKTVAEWNSFVAAVPSISDLSLSTCVVCGAGYYLVGETCTCVGNGYYSEANDNDRHTCKAGQYCAGCSAAGTPCPDGTYRTTTGGTSSAS
ncbi:hypothetical protein EOL99_03965, partial [Candidatus Falkowbacteria bacterium]|nr:hypothetical protein [Candidatus Falkowbacteria bacterium]